jgi:hypothetical protein
MENINFKRVLQTVRHTWVWTTDNVKSTLEEATKTQRGRYMAILFL